MLQNPRKTLGFKKNMVYKIPPYPASGLVRKKVMTRNLYNQVPRLTQDTVWESDTNTRKHHIHESHEISAFLTGVHKAARNKHCICPFLIKIYDKRDDFDIEIVNFPFLDGNVPCFTSQVRFQGGGGGEGRGSRPPPPLENHKLYGFL